MKINANLSALVANKQLFYVEKNMTTSMERLSSGLKLNHAKDNPAGMAISNKMRTQIAGLNRASQNASDGIAVIQIADGALSEVNSMLQRMRELSVQAASDTNSLDERQAIQNEIDALKEEITRVSTDTEYNEMPILDGSLSERVYSEGVERISISDAVTPGKYKLSIDAASKRAQASGDAGTAIDSTDNLTEIGVEGSISINGYSIDIKKEDTQAQVYEKLRDAAEIGATELSVSDDGALSVTAELYGKESTVDLRFSNKELADVLGFSKVVQDTKTGEYVYGELDSNNRIVTPTGTDAEISLETKTGAAGTTGFGKDATIAQNDKRITITDKDGFSMTFMVDFEENANQSQPREIEIEVTDVGTMTLHIGANENQNMIVSIPDLSAESLYIDEIDVTKMGGASAAITRIDEAIRTISSVRSALGAYQNRLEYSVTSLDTFEENMTDALSRLSDTDMAKEMTTYTQQNVLNQAAISVLSQANDMPQQVLQLLQ